jgi:ATP-dependent Clp protease protease subunit
MSTGIPIPPTPLPPPDIAYISFSEEINEQSAGRFIHWMNLVSLDRNPRHEGVHVLFNSSGGMITDAINLRNYVKGYPPDIQITMFNTGGVQSAAVMVFVSAPHRVIAPHAKFMLHPAVWKAPAGLNTEQMRYVSRALGTGDKDIDDILKERVKMPDSKWKQARRTQLDISAQEAIDFGFADEIGNWSVPEGKSIFSTMIAK